MCGDSPNDSDIRGRSATRSKSTGVSELATRQFGVIGRHQLLELGESRDQIDRAVSHRTLLVMHRSVYAVGHRWLTPEGWWVAGVLAGGPGATLSHRAAADLWGLSGLRRAHADVTVTRRRLSRPRLTVHECALASDEVTVHRGIRVTNVPRTLLDLATFETATRLEAAIGRANDLKFPQGPSLTDLIDRHPRRRGIAALRQILGLDEIEITRSELELRFLDFLDRRGLPRPKVNARLHVAGRTLEVDCYWPEFALVVELDGRFHHLGASPFEADRARDMALVAAGLRSARVTWRRLHEDPELLEADLRHAMRRVAS
jgi:very-short-patch-repair endonuclease